jgi:hypothetical protein
MNAINMVILFVSLGWVSGTLACEPNQGTLSLVRANKNNHVKGPYLVENLEKSNLVALPESGLQIPFGKLNDQWEELKSLRRPGDEVFMIRYSERDVSNEGTNYRETYDLVRDGCLTFTLTTNLWYESDHK